MKIRLMKPVLLGLLTISVVASGAYQLQNLRIDDATPSAVPREPHANNSSLPMRSPLAGASTATGNTDLTSGAPAALQELRLSATLVSENPAASRALILVQGRRDEIYSVGDLVTSGLVIVGIKHDRVLLDDTSDQSDATLPLYVAYAPRTESADRRPSRYHDAGEKARAAGITYGGRRNGGGTIGRDHERILEKLRARRKLEAERQSTLTPSPEQAAAAKAEVAASRDKDFPADFDEGTTDHQEVGEFAQPFEENENR